MKQQQTTEVMSSLFNTIIANGHYLLRESLKMILEETKMYKIISEVSSVRLLSSTVNGVSPDLILCDFYLPGGDIVEQLKNLKLSAPTLKVVVFIDTTISDALHKKLQNIPVAGLIPNESSGYEILKVLEQVTARKAV